MATKYGLLLPHFGEHASPHNLLEGAKLAEAVGFDSVWVRDHLIFEPHGEFEKANRDFYDPLITLTAIGAVTNTIGLGTGSLIPYRHPLQTALIGGTMTQMFGPRVIFGMGAGTFDHEFEAVGLDGIFRPDLVRSQAHVMRKVWTENNVSYKDDFYEFSDVTIEPKPLGGPIPYWYCGNTPASARRAVDHCDGWMPGRITLPTFRKRVDAITQMAKEQGKKRPTIAVIPPTSIDHDAEKAWSYINVEGLLDWANNGPGGRFWVKPQSGTFERVEDLEGSLIAGTPEDAVRECRKYEDAGCEHLVFDFRFKFDQWFQQIELLGTEVLPQLRVAVTA